MIWNAKQRDKKVENMKDRLRDMVDRLRWSDIWLTLEGKEREEERQILKG